MHEEKRVAKEEVPEECGREDLHIMASGILSRREGRRRDKWYIKSVDVQRVEYCFPMAQARKYSVHALLISLSPWIARRMMCAATGIICGQLSDRKGECVRDGNWTMWSRLASIGMHSYVEGSFGSGSWGFASGSW